MCAILQEEKDTGGPVGSCTPPFHAAPQGQTTKATCGEGQGQHRNTTPQVASALLLLSAVTEAPQRHLEDTITLQVEQRTEAVSQTPDLA